MTHIDKTSFENTFGLAELPWFELTDDNRLRLCDASVGPIVDVHTHLALAFGGPMRVDLAREMPRTEHYLPVERTLDLEGYANLNFTPADLKTMKRDLSVKSLGSQGMRASHTVPNLTREMADLGIRMSVLLPIDAPVLSRNAETYLEAVRPRTDLLSLGSVHPLAKRVPERLEAQKKLGARGIKYHPAVMHVAPDHPKAMAMYPICGELGLPVLFHAGPVGIETSIGRKLSQMKHYWSPIAENPGTKFILGHSGALQMELALELAQRYENCWLELASQSLSNVRRILDEGPEDRIMLGSDWPFYHQSMVIAKVLLATQGRPELRARVLHENAARLFDLDL